VDASVAAGRFQNANEVIQTGLRLLQLRELDYELKLEALRAAFEVGLDDVRHGRVIQITPGRELEFIQSLGRTEKSKA
jgi:antitoxin ParD1/3/4